MRKYATASILAVSILLLTSCEPPGASPSGQPRLLYVDPHGNEIWGFNWAGRVRAYVVTPTGASMTEDARDGKHSYPPDAPTALSPKESAVIRAMRQKVEP